MYQTPYDPGSVFPGAYDAYYRVISGGKKEPWKEMATLFSWQLVTLSENFDIFESFMHLEISALKKQLCSVLSSCELLRFSRPEVLVEIKY